MIADLKLYHRTPVSMYSSPRLEGMKYAVWYLRIRDKKYTANAFDGILKIEKILVTEEQMNKGLDTEEVDLISANIINERNPVCYGADFFEDDLPSQHQTDLKSYLALSKNKNHLL